MELDVEEAKHPLRSRSAPNRRSGPEEITTWVNVRNGAPHLAETYAAAMRLRLERDGRRQQRIQASQTSLPTVPLSLFEDLHDTKVPRPRDSPLSPSNSSSKQPKRGR